MSNENIKHLNRLVEELKQEYYKRVPDTSEKTVVWADKAFNNMYKLLLKKVGVNTLRKIFNGQYIITSSTQKINTLSTLCQFLGYKNWDDFIKSSSFYESKDVDDFLNILIEYNRKLWRAYEKLPNIYTKGFSKYLVEESKYKRYLINDFVKKADFNLYLSDVSSFSIIQASLKWITNKKACVQTNEQWITRFEVLYPTKDLIEIKTNEVPTIKSNYIYLFIKKGGTWKIGLKQDIGEVNYEDVQRIMQAYNIDTKEITKEYPVWRQETQMENFEIDDEEFEIELVDYYKLFPEELEKLKNK